MRLDLRTAGVALSIAASTWMLGGCESGNPLDALADTFTPESPSEKARDFFNIYDADKRRDAVASFSGAPYGGEAPYLRAYRLLVDDPDATVRAAAIRALGIHGAPEDVQAIVRRSRDRQHFVRWEVAKALQKLHNPIAIAPLIDMMNDDESTDVRMAAARGLGQYPRREVFDALVGALDDPDYGVIKAAHHSLVLVTGYDFGDDPSMWLIYARRNPNEVTAHHKEYKWQPFDKGESWLDQAQFWKDKQTPAPRRPTGADASGDEAPKAAS